MLSVSKVGLIELVVVELAGVGAVVDDDAMAVVVVAIDSKACMICFEGGVV